GRLALALAERRHVRPPMADAAMGEITPPCTGPMGLVCAWRTGSVTTATPSENDVSAKPMRSAAGGAGISLPSSACIASIIRPITGLLPGRRARDVRAGGDRLLAVAQTLVTIEGGSSASARSRAP